MKDEFDKYLLHEVRSSLIEQGKRIVEIFKQETLIQDRNQGLNDRKDKQTIKRETITNTVRKMVEDKRLALKGMLEFSKNMALASMPR